MKIHLTDSDGNVHWLAGHDVAPECARGSAYGFRHRGNRLLQENQYARGVAGDFFDRGNFTTELSFSARRTFDTTGEALLFIADYDRATPREGLLTQLIENPSENGGFEKRYLAGAVVDPPEMSATGCTVDMTFTVRGTGTVTATPPV